ncbi:ACP S-malonyltransferase [Streptomyces sp. NBC_00838]|uniref:ACP S-malonyltransferase n=1 Tax=Streptomyces sp. NBC_00838 TaxID=2903680 RepID=UPI003865DE61|nr:ACP S-malonyltransferase [Streptomyces sp. NBC_00838]
MVHSPWITQNSGPSNATGEVVFAAPWGVAAVFPGVGSQYTGMAAQLHKRYGIVRETFAEASEVLEFDVVELCTATEPSARARLNLQTESQLALLTMGVAMYRACEQELGRTVTHTAGHSLGEYTALCAAGALPFAAALRLVRHRGRCVADVAAQLDGGMMWVTGLDTGTVEHLCRLWREQGVRSVHPSIIDGPRRAAVSGLNADLRDTAEEFEARGGQVFPLRVTGPFHSPLMAPAADALADALTGIDIAAPRLPVISGVDAQPHPGGRAGARLLAAQLVSPVRWHAIQRHLAADGVGTTLEMGPGRVLTFLSARTRGHPRPWPVDRYEDFGALARDLRLGADDAPAVIDACLRIAVSTPTRRQDTDVASHHRRLEETRNAPAPDAIAAGLEALDALLTVKGIDKRERHRHLAAATGGRTWQ